MRVWPESLVARCVLAVALGCIGVAALAFAVSAGERAVPAAGALASPPQLPMPLPRARASVQPCVGPVLLAANFALVPADVAPVVQLLADGSEVMRRPVPRADRPDGSGTQAVAAAVVLPPGGLGALDPVSRGALVELFGRLVAERPVPLDRFRTVGLDMPVRELEELLSWVP